MLLEMSITTHSASDTRRLGKELGELLEAGDVIFLSGDLGSGKTTFSKGVAEGLGVVDEVTSPTFTLVAEYEEGRVPMAHMDLYRLYQEQTPAAGADNQNQISDDVLAEIGWEDYLMGHHVVLVEWPDGLVDEVSDALHIRITAAPLPRVDERVFHCKATGGRSWHLLDEWVKKWLF